MATPSLDDGTAKEVLRQVESYFSDSNLPTDNFMKNTINDSEDGMVSLALICSFKKMKVYLKLNDLKPEEVPEDTLKAVAETLRKSAALKVSEDGKKVGRIAALLKPEEAIEQLDIRTIVIRTIAASPMAYDVTREDVESFFNQHAMVSNVRMPRHVLDKRVFCGTALIEFSTEEDTENVLKQSLVYQGVQLELKPKTEFDAERGKQEEEFKNSHSLMGGNQKQNSSEAIYPKGLIVAFTLKNSSFGGSVEKDGADENGNRAVDSSMSAGEKNEKVSENLEMNVDEGKEEKVEDKNVSESKATEEDQKSFEEPIVKDQEKTERCKAESYRDDMNVVLREDLKAVFEKFGTVKFIDFKIREESGYIRFEQPESAQKARAAAVLAKEGGLTVKNFIAALEPVIGDAERNYWSLIRGNQEKHRENFGNRGRGGKRFRGGGKHSRSRDGHPNKAQKVGAS